MEPIQETSVAASAPIDATPAAYKAVGAKIQQVMLELPTIEKTGYNEHHRYKYAPISEYLSAVHGPMAEAGLVLLHEHGPEAIVAEPIAGNDKRIRFTFSFVFRLVDVDSGETLSFMVRAQAIDQEDKAPGKALSLALKYFLGAIFLIAAEDAEADARPAQTRPRPNGQRQAQAAGLPSKKFKRLPDGRIAFSFGKQSGKAVADAPEDYIEWCKANLKAAEKKTLELALQEAANPAPPAGEGDAAAKYDRLQRDMDQRLNAAEPAEIEGLLDQCERYVQQWPEPFRVPALTMISGHDAKARDRSALVQTFCDRITLGEDPDELQKEFQPQMNALPPAWKTYMQAQVDKLYD